MNDRYQLYQGDCLDILPTLEAGSIDAVIADIPYGTTACKWDSVIPFAPMWAGIKHVLKPRGAAVLFGSQPFTSALVMSNVDWFKYEIIWSKPLGFDLFNAKNKPLNSHENILIFSAGTCANLSTNKMIYIPQMSKGIPYKKPKSMVSKGSSHNLPRPSHRLHGASSANGERYPKTVVKYNNADNIGKLHPTQKPVALMEYLIKTYTNEGDTVLDFTMGSGSTGVAAMNTGRNFIGIDNGHCEREPYNGWRWVDIAEERIANAVGNFTRTVKEKEAGQLALFGD